jgi:hypothetical protein
MPLHDLCEFNIQWKLDLANNRISSDFFDVAMFRGVDDHTWSLSAISPKKECEIGDDAIARSALSALTKYLARRS